MALMSLIASCTTEFILAATPLIRKIGYTARPATKHKILLCVQWRIFKRAGQRQGYVIAKFFQYLLYLSEYYEIFASNFLDQFLSKSDRSSPRAKPQDLVFE